MIVFTAELNKLAWRIKRHMGLSWGASLRMAIKIIRLPEGAWAGRSSVFAPMTFGNQDELARHYYGLAKANEEIGEIRRSRAFGRVSSRRFNNSDNNMTLTFRTFTRWTGVGERIANEVVDFFCAAVEGGITPRSRSLIERGANNYARLLRAPKWTF